MIKNLNKLLKPVIDLKVHDKTGIATITMNNPPVNAMTLDFMTNFCKAMDDLKTNNSKGLILTSALKNVFCAGLDIREFVKPDKDKLSHYYYNFQECWYKLFSNELSTVAAINGHSPAGGCVLALSTDHRIMRSNFTIGLNETAVGIVAPAWVMELLRSTISPRQAEKALIFGSIFSTDDALKLGVIDEKVETNEELMTRADDIMDKYNEIPQVARGKSKIVYRQKMIQEFLDTRKEDVKSFVGNVMNPQAQEKVEEILAKLSKK